MSFIGTSAFGLRMPIIKAGDNISDLVVNQLKSAYEAGEYHPKERDIIAITESIVARAGNRYVTVAEVVESIKEKLVPAAAVVLYNPIFSRNRFSIILRAFARAYSNVVIFAGDRDEVGNLRQHPITKIDYRQFYDEICKEENSECFWVSNQQGLSRVCEGFNTGEYGVDVVVVDCTLHPALYWTITDDDALTGAETYEYVVGRTAPICHYATLKSFCNNVSKYGLLGSNKATEELLKLYPDDRDQKLVEEIRDRIKETFNLNQCDVMIYGDGCYKDAATGIWEFADPVCSPAYTEGLIGMPAELKLKYLADDEFGNLSGAELEQAIKNRIKESDTKQGMMENQGTTPRELTSLLTSLCDLTSGSGSRGVPVVVVQNYFKTYADD